MKLSENRLLSLLWLSAAILVYDAFALILIPEIPKLGGDAEWMQYLVQKSTNGLTSTCGILWAWQMLDWITPNDWLEKIYENSLACAGVYIGLAYCVAKVWCNG